jgi:two-component system, cell cycle response regulator
MREVRGLAPRASFADVEPIPLSERAGALQLVRFGLTLVVVAAAAAMPPPVPRAGLIAGSLAYAAVTAARLLVRRLGRIGSLRLLQAMLLLDGVYLGFAMYATGGSASPLRVLVCVHVVAVTLLAAPRTGVKIALWHTLLYLSVFEAEHRGQLLGVVAPRAFAETSSVVTLAVSALGFWFSAIAAATCAAISERALRSRNVELDKLSGMVAEMARSRKASDVGRILLETLKETFGFPRGAVLASPVGEPILVGSVGALGRAALEPGLDRVVERAMAADEVALLRRLERETDPRLVRLLPDGRNVLVIPLRLSGGRQVGVLVLEHPGADRIPVETVDVVRRFAFHAALALHNVWSLEEVMEKPWRPDPGLARQVGAAET